MENNLKMKCGVQMFTLRGMTKSESGLAEAFRFVKSAGADDVQISFFCLPPIPPARIAAIARDTGVAVRLTHCPFDRITTDLERLIEEHREMGCDIIGLGSMPQKAFPAKDPDAVLKFCDYLNIAATRLHEVGMRFSYHNHAFEFKKSVDGRRLFDVLIEETVPEVSFCYDVYWSAVGKSDPFADIDRLGVRINSLHLKDLRRILGIPLMCAPGKGSLDLAEAIRRADRNGVPYAFVEVDIARDPKRAVTDGLAFFRSVR